MRHMLASGFGIELILWAHLHQRVFEGVEWDAELNSRALGAKEGGGAAVWRWASSGHNAHHHTHDDADQDFHKIL